VRSAREGIGADSTDPDYVIRREGQLLIDYAGSPIVATGAGTRAPDATGLSRDAVTNPLRLFSLFGPWHTLVLYAGADARPDDVERFERAAEAATAAAHGHMAVYLVAAPAADVASTVLPLVRDVASAFARAYSTAGESAFVVRPDGYLGFAGSHVDIDGLVAHLRATFG